jgi:hypothetical protein
VYQCGGAGAAAHRWVVPDEIDLRQKLGIKHAHEEVLLPMHHILEPEGAHMVSTFAVVVEGHPDPLAPVAVEEVGYLRPTTGKTRTLA